MANHSHNSGAEGPGGGGPPALKLNLIYPCTEQHVKKYSPQVVRMVTETPDIYAKYVRSYMRQKREEGRLNWVFNIIEGRTEQEDVILREHGGTGEDGEGFLLLPDLNWDRETMSGLHLLALVERRDIWSLRDLRKKHIVWLRHMRDKILKAAVGIYGDRGVEEDMLKLYVHCQYFLMCRGGWDCSFRFQRLTLRFTDQPTYYHFHIHVVNVMLEAGTTQATGKAFGLENIISQLEGMEGDEDAGMADVSLTYFLGEASELWDKVFGPLKHGRRAPEGF
jgi:m7GpppX diphosphatase